MLEFGAWVVAILVTWCALWLAATGIGLSTLRLLGAPARGRDGLVDAFWPGYAAILCGLQLWNLALPVQPWAPLVLFAAGAAGLARDRRTLRRALLAPAEGRLVAAGVVVAVCVAALAMAPASAYDTGLYHLQAVRWAEAYPAVPGLANLHPYVGYNNANHLLGAALDGGPWDRRGHALGNGLCVLAFALRALRALRRRRRRPARRAADALVLALVPGFVFFHWYHDAVSSFSPDLSAALLWAAAADHLLRGPLGQAGSRRAAVGARVVALLGVAAVVTKLSTLVLAGALGALAAGALLAARRRGALAAALVAAVGLAPWCARNVVLSGYPVYPSPAVSAPVEWRVPRDRVEALVVVVRAWARERVTEGAAERLSSWRWLPGWRARQYREGWPLVDLPVVLGAVGAVAVVARRRRTGQTLVDPTWLVGAAALAGVTFWFVMAPDVRVLGPALWLLPATVAALLAREGPAPQAGRAAAWWLLLLAGLTASSGVPRWWMAGPPVVWLVRLLPAPAGGLPPLPPTPPLRVVELGDGSTVWVAAGPDDRVWDAPLPTGLGVSPGLRRRSLAELGAGFRVEEGGR